jgi:hypothetical protein
LDFDGSKNVHQKPQDFVNGLVSFKPFNSSMKGGQESYTLKLRLKLFKEKRRREEKRREENM